MQQQGSLNATISEFFNEFRDQLLGSWRFRWQAIVLAWVVGIVAWVYVLSLPDQYRASSSLHIDSEDSLQEYLEGMAIQSDLLDDVNVILQSILSRPTLEKIASLSGFDLGQPNAVELEALIERLRDAVTLDLDRNQILEITAEHSNPDVAYAVVDVLNDEFVQGMMSSTDDDTQYAQAFLVEKLKEYEALLADAEARLADFKKKNIGQMPNQRGGYYDRLQDEMQLLVDIDSQIRLTRQRKDVLERQMAGEVPILGLMSSPGTTAATTSPQIEMLEAQLTELRLSYTDAHPDIVRIKDLIADLREELAATGTGFAPDVSGDDVDRNPVFQQMKIAYNQAELELSQLLTRRVEQAALVDDLRTRIDTIPEIEAELTRLTRNYDVYREQHNELLTRLETARLSSDAEANRKGLKFRVIDPPSVDSTPAGPPRQVFIVFAWIAAIAAGAGFAVLRSIMSPVFFSARRLERLFGVPVIGSVRKLESSDDIARARRGIFVFSAVFLAFVGCFIFVLTYSQEGTQLVNELTRAAG